MEVSHLPIIVVTVAIVVIVAIVAIVVIVAIVAIVVIISFHHFILISYFIAHFGIDPYLVVSADCPHVQIYRIYHSLPSQMIKKLYRRFVCHDLIKFCFIIEFMGKD